MNPDTASPTAADREQMEIADPRIQKLYDYLSEAGQKAYRDEYMLANAVFAKSELPREALDRYLEGRGMENVSFGFSLKKILRYFGKSCGWLAVLWIQGVAHRLSRQKFVPDSSKPLTILDIPLMPERIVKDGDLTDPYFPRLEERLQSKNMSYAYTPKFFGPDRPALYYRAFRLLKKKNRPLMTCFQMLDPSDYLKMFAFIIVYPFRLFRQINSLGASREEQLLRFFLWDTMDHTAVKNYARQLFGKRISELNVPSVRCISWYENQSQDKNFFRGLRSVSGKAWICGAQLYIWPATLLNLHADEKEKELGLIPDCILVNGTYYLREGSPLDFQVGPSMRYARLFQTEVDAREKSARLVLMPFFEYEIDKMLEMINQAGMSVEIFVKFHPATDMKKYKKRLEGKMQIVEDDLYALFDRVGCVIGKATGALVEAASLGIPVINIETGPGLSHDYMPRLGKGIIWESASTGTEIVEWVNKFRDFLRTDSGKIRTVAEQYGRMFFCEPTDEKIDEAFGLNESDKTSSSA